MSSSTEVITDHTKRRPGRRHFYGQPTVKRYVYWPPELEARLAREALSRNVRDGAHDKWTVSRVVVADLANLYGIELHGADGQDGSNGRSHD